jgi:hypothetical protein
MSVVITMLIFLLIKISLRNRQLFAQSVQAEMDRIMTMMQLEKLKGSNDVEKTDGFLKFVSDSRDWAFEYIENAQKVIEEYDEALSTQDAAKINIAYKKLIELLPKEESNEV